MAEFLIPANVLTFVYNGSPKTSQKWSAIRFCPNRHAEDYGLHSLLIWLSAVYTQRETVSKQSLGKISTAIKHVEWQNKGTVGCVATSQFQGPWLKFILLSV